MTEPAAPLPVSLGTFARRAIAGCLLIEVALVLLDLVFNVVDVADDLSIRRIFNAAREESLPTWFASTQAVAVGAVAFTLAWLTPGRRRWAWIAVGLFLVYVGADDAAEIHERVGSAIGRATEDAEVTLIDAFPTYAWHLFVAPLLAAGLLGSVVWGWIEAGSAAARRWLLVTVFGFAVSQGLDFVEGIEDLEDTWEDTADRLDVDEYVVTHTLKLTEETLEMVGTTGLLASFLLTLAARARGSTVQLTE